MAINYDKMLSIDRRIVYLIIALAIAVPTIHPLNLPVTVTPDVRGVFDEIEKLEPGTPILISVDYEPSTTPEMDPMSKAVILHCLLRGLKVIGISYLIYGSGIGEDLFNEVEKIYEEATGKKLVYGRDYCYLGYKPGDYAMIIGLGEDFKGTCKQDNYGKSVYELEILKPIKTLRDFPLMIDLHDDSYINYWIIYGNERTGIKIGSCCTAVMATGMYPFWRAGQITGIVGGLKGGSEYEKLVNEKYNLKRRLKQARAGMDAQSVIHIVIILFMLLGNFAFIMKTKQSKKQ
ncbi:hypothetical protein J7M23_02280 [Candidatus Sumerlaeota bacterium]|nr:hypothetical protein [Candidatus Sumerlaeota bacterium]